MRIPFWVRLLGLFSVVLLAASFLAGAIQYRTQRRALIHGYRLQSETIAGTLTPVFLDSLLHGYLKNPDNEVRILGAIREANPDLLRIRVFRDDGELMLSEPGAGEDTSPAGSMSLVRPITLAYEDRARAIGSLELVFSTKRLDEALAAQVEESLTNACFFALFGVVASLAISRYVTVPLGRLAAGMKRLREGDLAVRVPVESSDEIGDLAATFNETIEGLRVKQELLHYVSKSAWDMAHRRAAGAAESATARELTVLFSDIQEFTPFTEKNPPAEVVARLNEYFDQMVRVIIANGGTVDKFIGDAVMAIFEGPDAGAAAGVKSAREMQDRLAALRATGSTPFHARIGLNTGEVILGDIGSQETRRDFTCIGDPVNVAARLCYTCPADRVHIGAETFSRLESPPEAEHRTGLRVKGIERDLDTYVI